MPKRYMILENVVGRRGSDPRVKRKGWRQECFQRRLLPGWVWAVWGRQYRVTADSEEVSFKTTRFRNRSAVRLGIPLEQSVSGRTASYNTAFTTLAKMTAIMTHRECLDVR